MSPVVDVVIVAHDSGELLLDSVASAVAEVGEARVIVVDAESIDGSIAALRERFPGVRVIPAENRGFSAGNNRGIEASTAEYVMLLNPDAIVAPGSVAALVGAMEAEPDAGIVAPVVRNPNGTVQAGSYGRFPSLAVRVGTGLRRLGRLVSRRSETLSEPNGLRAVDWVTGAAMLVRRSAIDAVGAMDEAFFLYYEDIEWCHRMWDGGWRVLLEPSASAVHHLGKSGGRVAEDAYRASFERYCELYGLWGLRAAGRVGAAIRRAFGGRA